MEKKKLVIGVIGADVHAVGNTILNNAFKQAGFDVVNLGVMVTQEEYIQAAIESGAADMDVAVKVAVKKIDQATAKGILHKNTAGRKKSALVSSLNKAKA